MPDSPEVSPACLRSGQRVLDTEGPRRLGSLQSAVAVWESSLWDSLGHREPYVSTRRTWSGFFDIKKSNQRSGSGGIGKSLEQLQPRHSRVCSCLVPFQNSVRVPLPETSLLPFSIVQYYQCCSSATELSPLPRPSAYQLCSSDCLSAAAEFMPIYFICQSQLHDTVGPGCPDQNLTSTQSS